MLRLAIAVSAICMLTLSPCVVAGPPGPVPAPVTPQEVTQAPVAKIAGPIEANVGEQLKYTTDGSLGSDIQFSITPPTIAFEPVKLLDGKDTPGVIFTPSKPGTYYITTMLNANGKTAYVILPVVIKPYSTPPLDPINPDKTYFNLKDALKTDRAADATTDAIIPELESLISKWDEIAKASDSWETFTKTFKDASGPVLGSKIPNVRKSIKDHMTQRFPTNPNAKFDPDLVARVKIEILQTIRLSK